MKNYLLFLTLALALFNIAKAVPWDGDEDQPDDVAARNAEDDALDDDYADGEVLANDDSGLDLDRHRHYYRGRWTVNGRTMYFDFRRRQFKWADTHSRIAEPVKWQNRGKVEITFGKKILSIDFANDKSEWIKEGGKDGGQNSKGHKGH